MNRETLTAIGWFRNTAPYINSHRGATFLLMIPGDAQDSGALPRLLQDVALLASLGVRLVLLHGSRPQLNRKLADADLKSDFHGGRRITDQRIVPVLQEIVGRQRSEFEALLSQGLPNSPMQQSKLRVCSGNFVVAQPLGVVEGIDYQFTGRVRRVDAGAINAQLDAGNIVLLSSLGYSPTGEVFNLGLDDVAICSARALEADKLIILGESDGITDRSGKLVRQCIAGESAAVAPTSEEQARYLETASLACQAGVPRSHIVSYGNPDALLAELFTTDGVGTLVSGRPFEQSRWASINDVGGVLELIAPLEKSGVLLRRSRERLEAEIGQFRIIERDGRIVACAALYPFSDAGAGEIACIISHPRYQGAGRARQLLADLEDEARNMGLTEVFVLTTQTAHWFLEQGFQAGSLDALPSRRQELYNLQRGSKIFRKSLAERR